MSLFSARNLLNEPDYINTILEEYYNTIDKYKRQFTTSVPIRYFSINLDKSIIDEKLDAIYEITDKHLNGLVFDIYELAPTFYSSPITIDLSINEELTGLDIHTQPISITFIGVFNNNQIHLNDLAQFYTEYWNKQIFQVYNIRTPLITNFKVPIFELDLTTAPIPYDTILEKIRINEVFVYDYTLQKFITYEQFTKKDNLLKQLENEILPGFNNEYFDNQLELYYYIGENDKYYVLELNLLMYQVVDYINNDFLHIKNLQVPAGILNYFNNIQTENYIDKETKQIIAPKIYTIYKLTNPLMFRLSTDTQISLTDDIIQTIIDGLNSLINNEQLFNIETYDEFKNLIQSTFITLYDNAPIDKKLLDFILTTLSVAQVILTYSYK